MVVKRSVRFAQRQSDATETKIINRRFKNKERARRDARMIAILKTAKPPHSSAVLSWLSIKLDKKGSKVTAADVKSLLAAAK